MLQALVRGYDYRDVFKLVGSTCVPGRRTLSAFAWTREGLVAEDFAQLRLMSSVAMVCRLYRAAHIDGDKMPARDGQRCYFGDDCGRAIVPAGNIQAVIRRRFLRA